MKIKSAIRVILEITVGIGLAVLLIWALAASILDRSERTNNVTLEADPVSEIGVGRETGALTGAEVTILLNGVPAAEEASETVGAGDTVSEAAKWSEPVSADVLDYTSGVIWGWDGRYCELWEMDLYARILYLEFWGTSRECCEAGADSILRMLEAGYFGESLGAVLAARADNGALVYSTYAYVWEWTYDPDGLAEMYALAVERFTSGPVWIAPFFQLYYYPWWAQPCYMIDGVYFSTFKEVEWGNQ